MLTCIIEALRLVTDIQWVKRLRLAAPHTITIFLPALLALLIPNTTANHTITYTNIKHFFQYRFFCNAQPQILCIFINIQWQNLVLKAKTLRLPVCHPSQQPHSSCKASIATAFNYRVEFYNFQSKMLLDSISGEQISKTFLGDCPRSLA